MPVVYAARTVTVRNEAFDAKQGSFVLVTNCFRRIILIGTLCALYVSSMRHLSTEE